MNFGMLFFVFVCVTRYFSISLSLVLWPIDFSRVCFKISTYFCIFQFSVLLISSFISLQSEKTLYMPSMLLNFLRNVLWPNVWSIFLWACWFFHLLSPMYFLHHSVTCLLHLCNFLWFFLYLMFLCWYFQFFHLFQKHS